MTLFLEERFITHINPPIIAYIAGQIAKAANVGTAAAIAELLVVEKTK
ncbi:MAG: hypothetical protein ACRD5J_13555 [Nitrososphaeraceae archaeon]